MKLKNKKVDKITCRYGKAKFLQKYNRERDVKNAHQENDQVYVRNGEDVMEASKEAVERTSQESTTFQMLSWVNEEILNVSFTSETEQIFDVSMSIDYKETPI